MTTEAQQQAIVTETTKAEPKTNLEYLKDMVKYLGFDSEKIGEALKTGMENGDKIITVGYSQLNDLPNSKTEDNTTKDYVTYDLNFSKAQDGTDKYFFNNYNASLQSPLFNATENQKFYITNGKGVTAKESYNMLAGRAVLKDLLTKEGTAYKAFIQLDFNTPRNEHGNLGIKSFHQNYGFDVASTLDKYPIKELETPTHKDALIKSLEKGNLQKAELNTGEKIFIETNPQFKTLNFYNADLQSLKIEPMVVKEQEKAKSSMKL